MAVRFIAGPLMPKVEPAMGFGNTILIVHCWRSGIIDILNIVLRSLIYKYDSEFKIS